MKKVFLSVALILAICFSVVFAACDNKSSVAENGGEAGQQAADDDETPDIQDQKITDDVPEMDLGGYEFRILSSGEIHAWHGSVNVEEETGDLVNDSIYRRNRVAEGRLNILITETEDYNKIKKSVNSGSDDYDFVTGWCDPMFGYFVEGLGYKFHEYGRYIDLGKPYWDSGLTQAFTFKDMILFPVGAVDITTYDLIHVLLFNKKLIAELELENPYGLVKNGEWTFDKYAEMVKLVVRDVDGNGVMNENDMYGLVSMVKYVLPCFWVAAGVETVARTSSGLPDFTLPTDEKFASVIEKIFSINYDNNSWYQNKSDRANYSEVHDKIFMDDRALFYNNTFKMVEDVRGMETDFGIVPYPKYTANQEHHYTRMEGCFPFIVPLTVPDPETIGAIIEVLACESLNYVIPAYYEVSLKTKHARDEESAEMLDIIFSHRVIDLGDSIWCSKLRDNIFVDMFSKNDRNLASRLEKVEPQMIKEIEKALAALDLTY
ncbi:MAG: hypothetical protein FWG34_08525 [Oscillospiraceae bacterium]|nr:hypothetical protein [Oscillospiraceae bacterium]